MHDAVNSSVTILAIDPGMSGAVARIGGGELIVRRDFKTLHDIATAIVALRPGSDLAVIEQVGARPGEGVCSVFSFGKNTGVAFGALYVAGFAPDQVTEVHPLRWQNFCRTKFGLDRATHPEFDSRALAIRLFPEHADLFKRKKDHNTADAVLLGLWRLAQVI